MEEIDLTDKTASILGLTERLAAIVNTAIDGIITINDRGIVDSINPAACLLFGFSSDEVIGNNINMLMPEPYRSQHDGYMESYHHSGRAKIIGIGREVSGRRKNGSIFPLRLAVSEMFVDGRRMYTGIIHDLTDMKQAEAKILQLNKTLEDKVANRTEELAEAVDQLLGMNQQLQHEIEERLAAEAQLIEQEHELQQALDKEKELNALKTRFVSMASHEFRTPLSTILSSAELVEMYQNTEQQPQRLKHIDRIKRAVGHLNDILHDFLSMSRLEEGKLDVQLQVFDISALLNSLKDEVQLWLKPGQTLHLSNVSCPDALYSDPKIIRSFLINLLSNASKYSDEGQRIELTLTHEDEHCRFVVRDYGMGIPEEDQAHLFTRFYRARNVENIKGTGLGLHIVKRYVELLKGRIAFESEQGKGSTFTIYLPINN